MKINSLRDAKLGLGNGLIAGATWGVDTVLVGIIMASTPFITSTEAIFLAPFVATFMHDFFSALWATLYMIIKGQFKNVLQSLKTKNGGVIVLGALIGGPVGMTCYLLSVKYIGPAYTAAITAVFPAVSALLAGAILKEKINARVWLGIGLSVVGVFVLGYMPSEFSIGSSFTLGLMFAIGTVFAWSLEGIICALGMKDGDMNPEHAINIRQATSGLLYAIVIIPFINGYDLALSVVASPIGILIAVTALVGTISYICYYKAINTIGAARSTSLNITYVVWAIILQIIFMSTPVGLQLIAGSLIVIVGAVLVAGNPKELVSIKDLEGKIA
ncbi:DMT family transporter [Bacillus sp. HNG]|uniref:DMT family transporter n=1 Tax=Bacillus sp. HNG TaxID=2293325 RepID=UPI000E2FBD98|nr:DMT family transporter [Bacillus sp. HNG]RFB11061.1 DMT family transporter [Bacillus sp. HNG]